MITKDNVHEIVHSLMTEEKNEIKNSECEYIILHLHISNSGYVVTMELTNDYEEQDLATSAILELDYVLEILEEV